jgi:hypothetical protein
MRGAGVRRRGEPRRLVCVPRVRCQRRFGYEPAGGGRCHGGVADLGRGRRPFGWRCGRRRGAGTGEAGIGHSTEESGCAISADEQQDSNEQLSRHRYGRLCHGNLAEKVEAPDRRRGSTWCRLTTGSSVNCQVRASQLLARTVSFFDAANAAVRENSPGRTDSQRNVVMHDDPRRTSDGAKTSV